MDLIVDSFNYGGNPSNALLNIDPSKFPVIDGNNSTVNAKGLSTNDRSNIIVKNIQIKEFEFCFWRQQFQTVTKIQKLNFSECQRHASQQ